MCTCTITHRSVTQCQYSILLSLHIILMLCSDLQNRPVFKGHSEYGTARDDHTQHAGSSIHDRLFHLSMCTLTSALIAATSSQLPSHLCIHYSKMWHVTDLVVHFEAHQTSCWAILKIETPETHNRKYTDSSVRTAVTPLRSIPHNADTFSLQQQNQTC